MFRRARMRTSQRALFVFGALGALLISLGAVLRRSGFAVQVAGESMTPAFEAGDCVLVRRVPVPRGEHAAGLVVCVRGPDERLLLKRIVGVPRDSLRIGTHVQVGERPLDEPYA